MIQPEALRVKVFDAFMLGWALRSPSAHRLSSHRRIPTLSYRPCGFVSRQAVELMEELKARMTAKR
jgi:hypothetical protein